MSQSSSPTNLQHGNNHLNVVAVIKALTKIVSSQKSSYPVKTIVIKHDLLVSSASPSVKDTVVRCRKQMAVGGRSRRPVYVYLVQGKDYRLQECGPL